MKICGLVGGGGAGGRARRVIVERENDAGERDGGDAGAPRGSFDDHRVSPVHTLRALRKPKTPIAKGMKNKKLSSWRTDRPYG